MEDQEKYSLDDLGPIIQDASDFMDKQEAKTKSMEIRKTIATTKRRPPPKVPIQSQNRRPKQKTDVRYLKSSNASILANRLDFLYDIHLKGVELLPGKYDLLKEHGYIKQTIENVVDISELDNNYRSSGIEYMERIAQQYSGIDISTWMWKPQEEELLNYNQDFINWIDQINRGFQHRVDYDKFNYYVTQAKRWIDENEWDTDFDAFEDDVMQFYRKEIERLRTNSLYALNKYGFLKEGDQGGGELKYEAWECQAIICYLFDCGYNLLIGKLRQVGFTSTICLLGILRNILRKSYFIKFITHDLKKGEEIFEDKIKWPFGKFQDWMKPTVSNDTGQVLSFKVKTKKGTTKGANSRFVVSAPTVSAINGGAPNLVLIDEVGYIDILVQMMNEGRPALFFMDPKDNRMKMKRQLIAWGTGGEMDKGGAAFETEFMATLNKWKERDFAYGIVPLFFNAFSKPGVTRQFLEDEKSVYLSKKGPDQDKFKIQYHQHYPITIDDMFLRSSKTIISMDLINASLNKIYALPVIEKPQYGYMLPLLDMSKPTPGQDTEYAIRGAEFMPISDEEDERATVCVYQRPVRGWKWRYWQGTDPIGTETGHSKMGSSIWDAEENTVSAVMNYRDSNHKYNFQQSLLLGLYYDDNIKQLVESNIGQSYFDYIELVHKKAYRNLVVNRELPLPLQTSSGHRIGINNKTNTARLITNRLYELLEAYRGQIYIEDFFIQLKTYVQKSTPGGVYRYQAENLKYYFDDLIDGITFSYICREAFSHREPRKIGDETKKKESRYEKVYDRNYNLIMRRKKPRFGHG